MNITVFTSNQSRHLHLISELASIADTVFTVQECNTVFPGIQKDLFNNSPIMREYLGQMVQAEQNIFGNLTFSAENVRSLSLKSNDLSYIDLSILEPALQSDYYIVFGASYIRPPLVDVLVERQAVNIHMGVSPYYRGSSTNFWAMYDRNYHMVGATIHMLSRGLDSGDMLFHSVPQPAKYSPFDLGMQAVKDAHVAVKERLRNGTLFAYKPIHQDKTKEIRYTRNKDFTDAIVKEYLNNLPAKEEIFTCLVNKNPRLFIL